MASVSKTKEKSYIVGKFNLIDLLDNEKNLQIYRIINTNDIGSESVILDQ